MSRPLDERVEQPVKSEQPKGLLDVYVYLGKTLIPIIGDIHMHRELKKARENPDLQKDAKFVLTVGEPFFYITKYGSLGYAVYLAAQQFM